MAGLAPRRPEGLVTMPTITLTVPDGFEVIVRPRAGAVPAVAPAIAQAPAHRSATPTPAGDSDEQPAPRVKLAEHGSRFAATMAEVDGNLVEIPACVALALREIAANNGIVAFREETRAKFPDCLRWVLGMLRRDVKARVLNRRHVHIVDPALPPLIHLVRDLEPAHG